MLFQIGYKWITESNEIRAGALVIDAKDLADARTQAKKKIEEKHKTALMTTIREWK